MVAEGAGSRSSIAAKFVWAYLVDSPAPAGSGAWAGFVRELYLVHGTVSSRCVLISFGSPVDGCTIALWNSRSTCSSISDRDPLQPLERNASSLAQVEWPSDCRRRAPSPLCRRNRSERPAHASGAVIGANGYGIVCQVLVHSDGARYLREGHVRNDSFITFTRRAHLATGGLPGVERGGPHRGVTQLHDGQLLAALDRGRTCPSRVRGWLACWAWRCHQLLGGLALRKTARSSATNRLRVD